MYIHLYMCCVYVAFRFDALVAFAAKHNALKVIIKTQSNIVIKSVTALPSVKYTLHTYPYTYPGVIQNFWHSELLTMVFLSGISDFATYSFYFFLPIAPIVASCDGSNRSRSFGLIDVENGS